MSRFPFVEKNRKLERKGRDEELRDLRRQLAVMGGGGFNTGLGEDGRLQPDKPTHMLNTNAGQRTVHEGEQVNVGQNGQFNVVPASQIGGQRQLQQLEQATRMPGFQAGVDDPRLRLTKQGETLRTTVQPEVGGGPTSLLEGIKIDPAQFQVGQRTPALTGGDTLRTQLEGAQPFGITDVQKGSQLGIPSSTGLPTTIPPSPGSTLPTGVIPPSPGATIAGQQPTPVTEAPAQTITPPTPPVPKFQPEPTPPTAAPTAVPFATRGLQRLERFAEGKAPFEQQIREEARGRFKGEEAAARGAQAQELAQAGIGGREAMTAQARLSRDIGAQEADFMAQLRQGEAGRAFQAAMAIPGEARATEEMFMKQGRQMLDDAGSMSQESWLAKYPNATPEDYGRAARVADLNFESSQFYFDNLRKSVAGNEVFDLYDIDKDGSWRTNDDMRAAMENLWNEKGQPGTFEEFADAQENRLRDPRNTNVLSATLWEFANAKDPTTGEPLYTPEELEDLKVIITDVASGAALLDVVDEYAVYDADGNVVDGRTFTSQASAEAFAKQQGIDLQQVKPTGKRRLTASTSDGVTVSGEGEGTASSPTTLDSFTSPTGEIDGLTYITDNTTDPPTKGVLAVGEVIELQNSQNITNLGYTLPKGEYEVVQDGVGNRWFKNTDSGKHYLAQTADTELSLALRDNSEANTKLAAGQESTDLSWAETLEQQPKELTSGLEGLVVGNIFDADKAQDSLIKVWQSDTPLKGVFRVRRTPVGGNGNGAVIENVESGEFYIRLQVGEDMQWLPKTREQLATTFNVEV